MRIPVLGVALASLVAVGLRGQAASNPRNLLRLGGQAYDFAEYEAARSFLIAGLNPAAGPRDSLWVASVHRLAHILIQEKRDSVAAVWLRWALRLQPGLAVDTVNFPPAVEDAFALARSVVAAGRSADTLVETNWEWAQARGDTTQGAVRIERSGAALSGFVEGLGPLTPGAPQPLGPGSYTITASAPGYFRTRVTREVLPGITTVIRFRLRGLAAQPIGFLYVASTPWGSLYVDGEPAGYTPIAAHPVAPGTHRVRIERTGFTAFDTVVAVARDQRLRLGTVRLRAVGSR